MNQINGYKVFNPDWTCKGFQYEVGKTYEMEEEPVLCKSGFHFCERALDCFNYYSFDPENKVAEVVAHGKTVKNDNKSCTNKIEIVREIPWEELLIIVNTGKGNTGLANSGDRNSGYRNSGDRNSGYGNSGYGNSGDRNSGYRNSGDRNSGYGNSGYGNSGYGNSGDYNLSNYNSGCFCTETHNVLFFDKESNLTIEDWHNSPAYGLLCNAENNPLSWICDDAMSEQEKADYPEYKTTGGYLRKNDISDGYRNWWKNLSRSEKQIIFEIPNFNAEKFSKITGIEVELLTEAKND